MYKDLDAIASGFAASGFVAVVRGSDRASFVYSYCGKRAVELSYSDAGICVEFYERDDESPKFDRTFGERFAAVALAHFWLAGANNVAG
jgi:hypothetical protein